MIGGGSPLDGKTVAVTGGTGTFGAEMLRQALAADIASVRVISRNEHRQAALRAKFPDARARWLLRDVTNAEDMEIALRGADVVFHAAAMKRIEACADNPAQAIETNVNGTARVCRGAMLGGAERVIVISSDKACAPVTIYGYTKGLAEQIALGYNVYMGGRHRGIFSAVRYGNVAGSQGSIIPLWRAALKAGAPLKLTSRAMTRFWITIEDAVAFAIKASRERAGYIYVPGEMKSFRLIDLAVAMGGDDVALEVIGPRGAEKDHEDLVASYEPEVVGARRPLRSNTNEFLSVAELRQRLTLLNTEE